MSETYPLILQKNPESPLWFVETNNDKCKHLIGEAIYILLIGFLAREHGDKLLRSKTLARLEKQNKPLGVQIHSNYNL